MPVTWLLYNGIHKENVSKMKIMQIVFICIHCECTSMAHKKRKKETWANIFGADLESGSSKRKKKSEKMPTEFKNAQNEKWNSLWMLSADVRRKRKRKRWNHCRGKLHYHITFFVLAKSWSGVLKNDSLPAHKHL